MPTILDYYQYSQLATAAYVSLERAPKTNGGYVGPTVASFSQAQSRLPTAIADMLFDQAKSGGAPV